MRNSKPQKTSGKPIVGSRAPGIGYLYIAVIMFLAMMAGTLLSGGFIPVDPNSPKGPPTLPPYFQEMGQDTQRIVFPSGSPDPRNNLQLKTFKVNVCGSKAVIDLLVDTSESMVDDGKINRLKEGLREFTQKLAPSAVIGIHTFSGTVQERVPLDYVSANRTLVTSTIDSMSPDGWTRMRDGFQLVKEKVVDAIQKDKYPGYKYFVVLLSDGVPEIPKTQNPRTCKTPPGVVNDPLWCGNQNCAAGEGRCFTEEQDPREPTNLAQDLKDVGVEVYSVGIFSQSAVSDQVMRPYFEELLQNVASEPSSAHYFGTDQNALNLEEILQSLVTSLCDEEIGTSAEELTPTTINYPFVTYPDNATHVPFAPPGGEFNTGNSINP